MTLRTNARIAGITYLAYIGIALPSMTLMTRATRGEGIAAKLAGIAANASDVQLAVVLGLLTSFTAWVLAVTLYAITRKQDRDIALIAMVCRVGEGVVAAFDTVATLGLLWLATGGAGASDPSARDVLGGFLLKMGGWDPTIGGTYFAVGSTLFSWLLLRGRMIPVALAWLGVLSSALIAVALPARLAGFIPALPFVVWLPILVFEVTLALWLIVKGVAAPRNRQVAA